MKYVLTSLLIALILQLSCSKTPTSKEIPYDDNKAPVLSAPIITTQPVTQSILVGQEVTFTVVASGNPSPYFQWSKDSNNIAGATSSTYSITSAQASHAGSYIVLVSNSQGYIYSTPATLTVNLALSTPAITIQPVSQSFFIGQNISFSVVASGVPTPTYQWRKDGSNISGATSSTYSITSAQSTHAGSYTVYISNSQGYVESNSATLTVSAALSAPTITTQPVSRSVTAGDNVVFSVVASGVPTPTYQWRKDGSNISGATSSTYSITSAQSTHAGSYTVYISNSQGYVESNSATLTVSAALSAPTITTQPVSRSVTAGDNVVFSVVASGVPTPTYQWRKDGSNISGATSSTYSITSAQSTHAGSYSVYVSNSQGNITSSAVTLTVVPLAAPTISTQPSAQSVTVGQSATFTIVAIGNPTPTYLWRKDGSNISGATSSTYYIPSAQQSHAGSYSVYVSNNQGNLISNSATLTVLAPPVITTQPMSQTVNSGQSVSFSIVATGTPTLTYQWKFRSDYPYTPIATPISAATASSYSITNAQQSHDGDYHVVVTNSQGAVTSSVVSLTVNP